jgi:hypothetical protein
MRLAGSIQHPGVPTGKASTMEDESMRYQVPEVVKRERARAHPDSPPKGKSRE